MGKALLIENGTVITMDAQRRILGKGHVLVEDGIIAAIGENAGTAPADAERIDTITYRDALQRGLKVVDSTAFSLCMDNGIDMRVFGMEPAGNVTRALLGESIGTLVTV